MRNNVNKRCLLRQCMSRQIVKKRVCENLNFENADFKCVEGKPSLFMPRKGLRDAKQATEQCVRDGRLRDRAVGGKGKVCNGVMDFSRDNSVERSVVDVGNVVVATAVSPARG